MSEVGRKLYYMSPIQNVPAILRHGVLSFNQERGSNLDIGHFGTEASDPGDAVEMLTFQFLKSTEGGRGSRISPWVN